jgi:two-component system sensor histidine kinase/response regulator
MSIKKIQDREIDIPVKPSTGVSFEDLVGVDVKGALKRLKVDMKTFAMSLAAFAEDYTNIIDKIKNALDRKDVLEARRLLHTLRGAAGNIGSTEVETTAKMLGTAVKEGQDNLEPLIGDLEIALNTVLESIQSFKNVNIS